MRFHGSYLHPKIFSFSTSESMPPEVRPIRQSHTAELPLEFIARCEERGADIKLYDKKIKTRNEGKGGRCLERKKGVLKKFENLLRRMFIREKWVIE
jgi:hypothetical protein